MLSVAERGSHVPRAIIVGFGNTLRGDDGLGPYIVEELEDTSFPPGVAVHAIVMPQLDLAVVPEMRGADIVILIDARADEDEELVKIGRLEPSEGLSGQTHSTHAVGIPDLLHILRDWYGTAPECYAVMPKGYDFSISETLSERARLAAEEARAQVISLLTLAFQEPLA